MTRHSKISDRVRSHIQQGKTHTDAELAVEFRCKISDPVKVQGRDRVQEHALRIDS